MFDLIRPVTTVACGPLRREDQVNADARGPFARQAHDERFDFLAAGHHQVGQLVDDDHDVRQLLGDLRFFLGRAGLKRSISSSCVSVL